MKKKMLGLLVVMMLIVVGCSNPEGEQVVNQKPEQEEEQVNSIIIYYIDEATGEVATKEVEAKGNLEEEIPEQLKTLGILSEDCGILNLQIKEDEHSIDLDMNAEFGNYIRNMGSSGSEQVIECLVRTYLEVYSCEQLKLTEEGQPLDTGHTVLDGYINYSK